jgi:hypothetical protein
MTPAEAAELSTADLSAIADAQLVRALELAAAAMANR